MKAKTAKTEKTARKYKKGQNRFTRALSLIGTAPLVAQRLASQDSR